MGRYSSYFILLAIFASSFCVRAQDADSENLRKRIAELRMKSNAHGRFVSELLRDPIEFEPIELNTKPASSPFSEISEQRSESVLGSEQTEIIETPLESIIVEREEPIGVSEDKSPNPELSENSSFQTEENNPEEESLSPRDESNIYAELYAPKVPQRRLGYYFGPFVGLAFADDSAVRYPKVPYKSKMGMVTGLRLGHDFGGVRVEGEYAFLTNKISHGRSNLHNLQSRFILEKSLGDRADLRGGIGLGVGFVDNEYDGKNYSGAGFSYDFLLGWSFRVMENWSINMDYRHYLTAAHENYDRLQGHIVEVSVGFDM